MPYRQPSRTAWVNVLFWKIGSASSIIERVKAKKGVMTSAISKKLFPACLARLRFLSRFNCTTPNSDNTEMGMQSYKMATLEPTGFYPST